MVNWKLLGNKDWTTERVRAWKATRWLLEEPVAALEPEARVPCVHVPGRQRLFRGVYVTKVSAKVHECGGPVKQMCYELLIGQRCNQGTSAQSHHRIQEGQDFVVTLTRLGRLRGAGVKRFCDDRHVAHMFRPISCRGELSKASYRGLNAGGRCWGRIGSRFVTVSH